MHTQILEEISLNLQKGKTKIIKTLVPKALEEGVPAKEILNDGLLAGMSIVGVKFKNNEIFVPEVLIAARAMKAGTEILKPYLVSDDVKPVGKVVLGTVRGDFHDIGKNLVKMMMEGNGLEVIDLGVDVAPETFVSTAKEQGAQIIACSALLTTTMGEMKNVVDLCLAEGIRENVKIMIGGAPITDEYCAEIGADAYTSDAATAAETAVSLIA
ncbi:MAG: corrinoid protein [Clostridia bacterium]|nr:corrinoid protein [Clostridia bacterium]